MTDTAFSVRTSRRAPWNRLAFRLGVGIFLGAAVILVAVVWWNLGLQRRHMDELVIGSAERGVQTIQRSTRNAMLRNAPQEVHGILESIGSQPGVERIRIYDREGRITISTFPDEVGHEVDKAAEQCVSCHRHDPPLQAADRRFRVRFFERSPGHRIVGISSPIRNEPGCTGACHAHPAEMTVLGVLDVQLSLDQVDAHVEASLRQMGTGLIVAVVAVVAFVGVLLWRMVVRPVRALTRASDRVATGDLSARVPFEGASEVGALARHWNRMVSELQKAHEELQEWSSTLESRVEHKTRELEEAHRQLLMVEKMASLGKLSAVVAHEINNPLAGIGTYARLLRKRLLRDPGTATAEAERILTMVEDEAGRCGRIVQNLLMFSRTPGARFTATELEPLLERCAMLVRHQAELQEVGLHVEVAPSLTPVECDASQIQQVVLVLAMNALEAMPSGGSLTIRARPAAAGGAVEIEVEDTGCGIPPEHLARIYEPFFSTKEQVSGCGLGLAVAYGIVRRHRGRIEVDSRVGSGTRFTIRLPERQPVPVEEETPS